MSRYSEVIERSIDARVSRGRIRAADRDQAILALEDAAAAIGPGASVMEIYDTLIAAVEAFEKARA